MKTSERYLFREFGHRLLWNPPGCSERPKLWYFHWRFCIIGGQVPLLISIMEISLAHANGKASTEWSTWNFVALTLSLLFILLSVFKSESSEVFIGLVMKRRAKLAARGVPLTAEKLLWFFSPTETAEEVVDLQNAKFEEHKARYDLGFARRWYLWKTIRSISPEFDVWVERAIKWGIWAWIGRHLK